MENSHKGILNLIKKFENNKKSSKLNSSAVSTAKFQNYGRESFEPMICTETNSERLELSVTKFTGIVHRHDWPNIQEKKQLLGIQRIRGGKTE